MLDPANLKWKDLVTPGTPIPTPWPKDAFETYTKAIQARRRQIRAANRPESEMDALFREEEKHDTTLLNEGPHADCIMFTRDNVPFCAVCRRAIEEIVDPRGLFQLLLAAVQCGP